jgi:organic radical activating enzyme
MPSTKQQIINEYAGGIKESFDPQLLRAFDVADQEINSDLRKSEKVQLDADKFRLSGDGIFFTLQGEGKTMGYPAVFLRLHVCNLRCVWCDAYYTWNPKSQEFWTESYQLTPKQVAGQMEKNWTCRGSFLTKRAVITGGEPLLQKDNIDKLMKIMKDWTFEIETNGTIMPTPHQLKHCQFNCSPKLGNSKNIKPARIKPDVLAALNQADTQFKFVVMSIRDIDEMERDYIESGLIDPNKIILMPQGVTPDEVWANAREIAEYAKKKGYRLLGRLHVDLWGAKRRV